MDETPSNTTEMPYNIADTNLPAVMASLEMLTVTNTLATPSNEEILKKTMTVTDSNENLNRRCTLRPRKRTSIGGEFNDNGNKLQVKEIDIKEYYLNKNLKRKLNSLETIFEEKDDTSESTIYMGVKRYRRMIQFQQKPSDSKIKKRKAKIKKLFGSKSNFKRKRASMQMLLNKLNDIRAESPAKVNNEIK